MNWLTGEVISITPLHCDMTEYGMMDQLKDGLRINNA